ncbi:MAG TPA: GNAT family N-acetyltransferase [Terriglobales bacterium]|nr:GNAT family N-acetyltransferase [Terriglobales bacterium]
MNFEIVPMQDADWPAVREIYSQGIATGNATFETDIPAWEKWNAGHHQHSRLIARDGARNLGWAALGPVSPRRVYAGVAEVSIYVDEVVRGNGIGKALLKSLIQASEQNGIWTLQAGIFPENTGSVALHKSCGFREVGIRCRIAQLKGRWRDVLLLERRSSSIGR